MTQMQPALFQSEIGIRLPFSKIDQYFQAFGPKKSKGILLAVDLPDLTKSIDSLQTIDAGINKLSSMDVSYMISIQNLRRSQFKRFKDVLNLMSSPPVSFVAGLSQAEGINQNILSPIFLPGDVDEMLEAYESVQETLMKNTLEPSDTETNKLGLTSFVESVARLYRNNGINFCLQLSGLMQTCRLLKINAGDMVKMLPEASIKLISLGGVNTEDPSVSSAMSHDIRVLYGHCLTRFGPQKTLVNFQDFLEARAQDEEPFAHLEQACRSARTLGPELGQAQLGKF